MDTQLKLALGVINKAGVQMSDGKSIFWMSFEDVRDYFVTLDVARVHENYFVETQRGWIPCGIGPGEAFDLTVSSRLKLMFQFGRKNTHSRGGNGGEIYERRRRSSHFTKGKRYRRAVAVCGVFKRTDQDSISIETILMAGMCTACSLFVTTRWAKSFLAKLLAGSI